MLEFVNLKSGRWDEGEARAYTQLVQWATQRLRSIAAESVGEVFARAEERFGDSYLYTSYPDGRSGSLLLEATARALAKPDIEPQDLVNILTMLRRHPNVLTAMLITAQAPDARHFDLEPHYGWLSADKERLRASI
jgi:hypothetical protein